MITPITKASRYLVAPDPSSMDPSHKLVSLFQTTSSSILTDRDSYQHLDSAAEHSVSSLFVKFLCAGKFFDNTNMEDVEDLVPAVTVFNMRENQLLRQINQAVDMLVSQAMSTVESRPGSFQDSLTSKTKDKHGSPWPKFQNKATVPRYSSVWKRLIYFFIKIT